MGANDIEVATEAATRGATWAHIASSATQDAMGVTAATWDMVLDATWATKRVLRMSATLGATWDVADATEAATRVATLVAMEAATGATWAAMRDATWDATQAAAHE